MEELSWLKDYLNEVYPITKGKYRIPLAVSEFSIEKEKLKEIEEKLRIIFDTIKEIVFDFLDKGLKGYLIDEYRKELYLKVYENYNFKFKGVLRFDFINNKLIEINADAVEGVIQLDITSKWFSEKFNFKGKPRFNREKFLELFDDKVIIIYPSNYIFVDEYFLEADLLKTKAIDEDTFYNNYNKIKKGYRIFRRAIDIDKVKFPEYWLERQNINDILFTIMGNKANLAYLFELSKENDELKHVLDIVAKTSLKRIFSNFVCKKPFSTHGEDILFNKEKENCVYQELIEIPQRKIEYLDIDNKIKEGSFYYDFNPYAFYDGNKLKFGNILMRFSKNKLLNVAQGGGVGFYTIL